MGSIRKYEDSELFEAWRDARGVGGEWRYSERLHLREGGEQKFSGFEGSQAVPIRLSDEGTFEGG
jgi:hypothetical protein